MVAVQLIAAITCDHSIVL